jgi:hypothetical protein
MEIMAIKGELAWPAADVWAVVSNFGDLKAWNPALLSCSAEGRGVGTVRTFTSKVATVKERVDEFDETNMKIGYSILSGSTIPVRNAYITITVKPLDASRSELAWTMTGDPEGPSADELREQVAKRYTGRIEDLRQYLRSTGTGAPHS